MLSPREQRPAAHAGATQSTVTEATLFLQQLLATPRVEASPGGAGAAEQRAPQPTTNAAAVVSASELHQQHCIMSSILSTAAHLPMHWCYFTRCPCIRPGSAMLAMLCSRTALVVAAAGSPSTDATPSTSPSPLVSARHHPVPSVSQGLDALRPCTGPCGCCRAARVPPAFQPAWRGRGFLCRGA